MSGARPFVLAYVGALVLPDRKADFPDLSHAAQAFQDHMVCALAAEGLPVDQIFTAPLVRMFPDDRRLRISTRKGHLESGEKVTQLGFVNWSFLKTITLAFQLLPRLLIWNLRHLRKRRITLLYNVYPIPGIVSWFVARITRSTVIPMVLDIHVPGSGSRPDTLFRRADFFLQTRTLPLCDGLIVLTRPMAMDFAPRVPFLLMDGAISEEPGALPPPGRSSAVMYSGTFSATRGIRLLVNSFELVQHQDRELWITGSGELQEEVERAAAANPRIRLFGIVPRDELVLLQREAAVLVNPIVSEYASSRYQFPSKLLEYMKTGTPVITTMTPGVEEHSEFVHVVSGSSPSALAEAIDEILSLSEGQREEMGSRARAHVTRTRNWSVQARRMIEFMKGLAGGQR